MSALMTTILFSCGKVIAIDVSSEKLALAYSFEATNIINALVCDPVQGIRLLKDGNGVDCLVKESVPPEVVEQAFASVRRHGGKCVFAAHPEEGKKISIDPYELICGKNIRGTWGGSSDPDRDVPLFAELHLAGKLPLEKLITQRYRLEEINSALDDLEAGKVGGPLIEIDPAMCADKLSDEGDIVG